MSVFENVGRRYGSSLFADSNLLKKIANATQTGDASGFGGAVGSAAATIGMGMVKSRLPAGVGPKLDALGNAISFATDGDWQGAAASVVNAGVFNDRLPWLDNVAAFLWNASHNSRAMGGVSPPKARQIMQESLETHFAKKNLFLISIKQSLGPAGFVPLNMFVTDVSYAPITITADAKKIGSAVIDQPNGTEAVEIRLTTMDDEAGTIRRWFDTLAANVVHPNGTFGVPSSYLVKIEVLHSFVTEDSEAFWLAQQRDRTKSRSAWKKDGWFRPVSLESELSRKDGGPEEFALVFHQYDTYYT